ncbi:MAG: hypothetical protein ACOC1P_04570 [Minisyncoccales bacterium]
MELLEIAVSLKRVAREIERNKEENDLKKFNDKAEELLKEIDKFPKERREAYKKVYQEEIDSSRRKIEKVISPKRNERF